MADLDQISRAIGRLEAAQEAHTQSTHEFREQVCKRLGIIEAKVDPLVAYRNRMYGGAAVIATAAGTIMPWIAKKLGIT